MIAGTVNDNLEGIIQVLVLGAKAAKQQVDAVIDTGFNGYLTLPPAIIAALQLEWLGREEGVLADGSVDLFDVYRATVIWDGKQRSIEIEAANTQSLLGMALMERHSLCIDVVSKGAVTIKPMQ